EKSDSVHKIYGQLACWPAGLLARRGAQYSGSRRSRPSQDSLHNWERSTAARAVHDRSELRSNERGTAYGRGCRSSVVPTFRPASQQASKPISMLDVLDDLQIESRQAVHLLRGRQDAHAVHAEVAQDLCTDAICTQHLRPARPRLAQVGMAERRDR